nr:trichohyalin-like [Labrus bergylta]
MNIGKNMQFEDRKTKMGIHAKKEAIESQRQLTYQVMEEIKHILEEKERETKTVDYLRAKTEQQQKDIDSLTSEKDEQYLLIKRLRIQNVHIMEKLKVCRIYDTEEILQLYKVQAEIYKKRETPERRPNEIIDEPQTSKTTNSDKMASKESMEPKEAIEQVTCKLEVTERLRADSLLSLLDTNKKIMLGMKLAKEQLEINMADTSQELMRGQRLILQHREQVEDIKHNMNVIINKIKQKQTKIQADVQTREAIVPQIQGKLEKKERKYTFETVKLKLCRILEGTDKLCDMLKECDLEEGDLRNLELKTETSLVENMKSDPQTQRQDKEVSMKTTQDVERNLAQIQSERDEIYQLKTKVQAERPNIQRDRQVVEAEMSAMKCTRDDIEREKQELEYKLEITKREIREMEVLKNEIEIKKRDFVKVIRKSKRTTGDLSKLEDETEHDKQDMEKSQEGTEGQRSKWVELNMEHRFDEHRAHFQMADKTKETLQLKENLLEKDSKGIRINDHKVNIDTQGVIPEAGEMGEDTKQGRTDVSEKSQLKWIRFQAKKNKREVEQWLEKMMKEKDESEIMKIKIQRQKEEIQLKLEDTITQILTVKEIKACIEKTAAEMKNTQMELLKDQSKMKENKKEVEKLMVSK